MCRPRASGAHRRRGQRARRFITSGAGVRAVVGVVVAGTTPCLSDESRRWRMGFPNFHNTQVSPRFASPQHTPERPLRVTPHGTPTGREPPVLSPLQAPADSFDNQRPDGRLRRHRRPLVAAAGRAGLVRLRPAGPAFVERPGPPARRPVPAPVGRGAGLAAGRGRPRVLPAGRAQRAGSRPSRSARTGPRRTPRARTVLAGAVRGLRQRAAPGLLHVIAPHPVLWARPPPLIPVTLVRASSRATYPASSMHNGAGGPGTPRPAPSMFWAALLVACCKPPETRERRESRLVGVGRWRRYAP